MSKKYNTATYTQCILIKTTKDNQFKQVCWVPTIYAKKGKILELKGTNNEWSEGWVVEEAHTDYTSPANWVEHHERDYKYSRSKSDI